MQTDYRKLTTFLVELGIDRVGHTERNYLAHLVSVYRLMQQYDQDEELCLAGMFHSIYGTEKFQGFKLPLESRGDITALIGERAERLAYCNCFMDRQSFDDVLDQAEGTFAVTHRETAEGLELSREDYDGLCSVHLFDWLEQVPRSRFGWDYRRAAYLQMTKRVGGRAIEAYDRVFAGEPKPTAQPDGVK